MDRHTRYLDSLRIIKHLPPTRQNHRLLLYQGTSNRSVIPTFTNPVATLGLRNFGNSWPLHLHIRKPNMIRFARYKYFFSAKYISNCKHSCKMSVSTWIFCIKFSVFTSKAVKKRLFTNNWPLPSPHRQFLQNNVGNFCSISDPFPL